MPKPFYKHKILLDENLNQRRDYPSLNEHFDVKHIKDDLRFGGMSDPLVYELAVKQGRIILTKNDKDFRALVREGDPGVIGIPENWSAARLDTKLTALLIQRGRNYFRGRFISLGAIEAQKKAA
jgi:predicted nuclease of predicted toxin-antitoxin system